MWAKNGLISVIDLVNDFFVVILLWREALG